jgi:hypothetical protein
MKKMPTCAGGYNLTLFIDNDNDTEGSSMGGNVGNVGSNPAGSIAGNSGQQQSTAAACNNNSEIN